MYVTMRSARLHGARILDGSLLIQKLQSHISDNYEVQMRAAVNVAGDPNIIATSAMWDELGAYQEFLEQLMTDPVYADFLAKSADMTVPGQEKSTILKVVKAAGEPDSFTSVVMATLNTSQMAEALEHALEIAEHVSDIIGRQIGLATVVAGDRTLVRWVGASASLAQYQSNNETISQDPGFQSLIKRGDGLYGEANQLSTLWRTI